VESLKELLIFSPRLFFTTLAQVIVLLGCGVSNLQEYSINTPSQILSVVGARPVTDERARFREIFCQLLAQNQNHGDKWENCNDYLLRLSDEIEHSGANSPLPAHDTRIRFLIVPGLFGECIADIVIPFEAAMGRLRALGYQIDQLMVSGRSSSDYNANQIAEAIADLKLDKNEALVLLGHSKGAVDILHFLVNYPELAQRVTAVVSIAGAINGSPLAGNVADAYEKLMDYVALGQCDQGNGGALQSLKRSVRLSWLAANPLPDSVQYFSVVTFTHQENINSILVNGYKRLKIIDPRNDGLLLYSDQVIPGANLLGYANADHWAVALPLEVKQPWLAEEIINHKNFPRGVLLEAVALHLAETMETIERKK